MFATPALGRERGGSRVRQDSLLVCSKPMRDLVSNRAQSVLEDDTLNYPPDFHLHTREKNDNNNNNNEKQNPFTLARRA